MSKLIGVLCILFSSLLVSIANVATRQLAIDQIHFSQILIFPCYFAVPYSVSMSIIDLTYNQQAFVLEATQLCYSVAGALSAVISMVLLSKALEYEEAGKISLMRTLGILLAYLFQHIILDVQLDFLALVGTIFVITGNLIVFLTDYANRSKSNCLCKCMAFKF